MKGMAISFRWTNWRRPGCLANWVTVSNPTVTVPHGGAADVPFSIVVPPNASPGGHYAGILIGTGSPTPQPGVSQVGVSSFVSALIFVQVSGNLVESANITQFSTSKSSYQTPDIQFAVRVENDGNVHVRPVGMIQIYNAFGKQRGEVPINETGNLGYVLPSSSREFDVDGLDSRACWISVHIPLFSALLMARMGQRAFRIRSDFGYCR